MKPSPGEIDKAIRTYELWKQTYPRDWIPHNNLALGYSLLTGEYDKAVEEAREALRLNPNHAFPYANLARAYLGLNRFEEAKAICEKAITEKLDTDSSHWLLYQIAFGQGDMAAVQRQAEWARGKPGESRMLSLQVEAEAYSGKLQKAREISRHAIDLAQRGNFKEIAAFIEAVQALREAEFGNPKEAREKVAAALAIAPSRDALSLAAVALGVSGDTARAQPLIEELAKRYPTDTLGSGVFLPTVRAATEINRGNPTKAIEVLQAASPYELGLVAHFLPIYVRGQAYLRAGKGTEAAAEFQKILDHRGVAPTSPTYALSYLGLGRAWSLAGDMAKSRRSYQDFLALWKDADPDIPILREAKAEYAGLK